MSDSIHDIVKTLEKAPIEIAQRYTKMLSQLILNFVSVAQKKLERSREEYQLNSTGLTVTSTKKRNPTVPFGVGRNDKLVGDDLDHDTPENKMHFRG